MIRVKVPYLFLIIGLVLFAILYNNYYPIICLVLTLVLPIILYIIIIIIKKKLVVEIKSLNSIGNKDEKVPFEIIVQNNSIFPISNCELRLSYYNNFTDKVEKEYIIIPAEARSTQKITCNIISKHCGNIVIKIDKIKIYDYIKLFSTGKKINCTSKISVLPEIHKLDIYLNSSEGEVAIDSNSFSKVKSGDDPSEVFNIREYAAGDKLQRIHWKLSTKQDELMVKEFSLPLNSDGLLLLEFFGDKKSLNKLEALIETTVSLSSFLLSYNYFHYLAWYDPEYEQFHKFRITSEAELFETLNLIMETKPYCDRTYAMHYHNSLNGNEKYSCIFYITSELSRETSEELHKVSGGVTILYINNDEEGFNNEEVNNLVESGINVMPINTENIKESIDKLVI